MQRQFKFRAWTGISMEYNVMVGFLGAFYVGGMNPKDTACMSEFNTIYSEQVPVMQFTGMLDKDGKEIYEGDIVTIEPKEMWNTFEKAVVEYAKEARDRYGFVVEYKRKVDVKGFDELRRKVGVIQVIGNIYQNPELLK